MEKSLNSKTIPESLVAIVSKSVFLTGECEEDFLIHVYYNEDTNQASDESKKEFVIHHALEWFERQDKRLKLSLIIEWFDLKAFYISTDISSCYSEFHFNINMGNHKEFNSVYNKDTGTLFYNCKNRQECLIESIQKANELYNAKVAQTVC